MYAVGDAYKVHTECIQAHKEVKREKFFFYFSLYCLLFYLLLPASSGMYGYHRAIQIAYHAS